MPAILRSVAKTDTFEKQRQIINSIASDLYTVQTSVGAGAFSMNDGTYTAPALYFTSQNNLGIYKGGVNTLSFGSNNTNVFSLSDTKVTSFKRFGIQKNAIGSVLPGSVITVSNAGSNYISGSYNGIPLTGGSGTGATANLVISGFGGSVTNQGSGYTPGTYNGVSLTGGSGTGATANIVIPNITGTVSGGSGYTSGTYSNVPLTGGSGTGATATIQVSGGAVASVVIQSGGNFGYVNGNVLSASAANIGGTGSGFTFTIDNFPFKIISDNVTFTSFGSGYTSGNILSVSAASVGGTGSGFAYTISSVGTLQTATLNSGGSSYTVGDVLSFDPNSLAASETYAVTVANTQLLVFGSTLPTTGFTVGGTVTIGSNTKTILKRFTSGSNITAVIVDTSGGTFSAPNAQTATSGGGTATVSSNTVANQYFFNLNDGNGAQLTPNITLLKNKTYVFSSPEFASHPFLFSTTADGTHGGGTQYTGSEVTIAQTTVTIKPNSSTPSSLYIYCANHPNMAGYDGREMVVTIGANYVAPGSGATITVNSVITDDTFSASLDGAVTSTSLSTATITTTSTITAAGAVTSTSTGTFAGILSTKYLRSSGASDLRDSVTSQKNFTVAPVLTSATGTISCSTTSTSVSGSSTTFLADFQEGYQLYDSENNLIGVVSGVSTNTGLTLVENAKVDISGGTFKYAKDWNIFSDSLTGFTGIKKVKPIYNLDVGGTFRSSGNSIIAEDTASKSVIGDRNLISNLGASDKLYVQGNLISSAKLIASSTSSLLSPSLTFTNNERVGLSSNSTNKYLSITGTSGELARYSSTKIDFYRDAAFTYSAISDFLIIKGSGYTNGTYNGILLSGGTGSGITANLTVAFDASISSPGSGYTLGTYTNVPLTGGSGTGAIATITVSTGQVYAATLVSGGSGYTTAPSVSFGTGAGGTGAKAVANLSSSGTVKTIGVNSGGSNYATAPTVIIGTQWSSANTVSVGQQYFSGSNLYTVTVAGVTGSTAPTHTSGSVVNGTATLTYAGAIAGATAVLGTTPGVDLGTVISVNVSSAGAGYTITPNISFTGGGGSGATASATLQYSVASLTITDGGSGYTSAPSITFSGGNGTGANFTSLITSSGVSSVVVTNGGSGYVFGDTLGFSHTTLLNSQGQSSTSPSTAAILTISATGSVTVVDITDQGNGYAVDDVLTIPVGAAGLSGGSGFNYTVKQVTNTETISIDKKLGKITANSINTLGSGILIDNNLSIDGTTLSSTQNEDIFISPGSSSRVLSVSGTGGVKLPVGNSTNRPSAATAGIIRYNTQTSQYEGSNGINFISLGGVRDVDGNTFIIAEETVGANDNTLYFFNDGTNSARLYKTELALVTATKITSRETDNQFLWKANTAFSLNAYVYYGDNLYQVTVAGTTGSSFPSHTSGSAVSGTATLTYVSDTYGNLEIKGDEIKLGTRINLDDKLTVYTYQSTNNIFESYLNKLKIAFGNNLGVPDTLIAFNGVSGSLDINRNYDASNVEDNISILDKNLKFFELTDIRYETSSFTLIKGASNTGSAIVYTPTLHTSAKIIVSADNLTTGDKQMIEFNVVHKESDIYAVQYGNTVTNGDLITAGFDFDVSNNVRFTATLTSGVATTNNVKVIVTKTQIKK